MDDKAIKYFVEAALLAAGRPLSIDQIQKLFDQRSAPEKPQIRQAIGRLIEDYADRGITISEVASGFRMQIESDMVERLQKLWEERPPRYSRALFETLALIAYRQPMTRGEIEEIRGVAVSTNIIRSLIEREWIRIVGHRDVPGRPAMFGTTRQFLDYFGLKKLDDLPPLADLSDWESLRVQLNLPAVEEDGALDAVDVPPPFSGDDAEDNGETGEVEIDDGEIDDAEEVAVTDIEPIAATEWPDPNDNVVVVHAGDGSDDADRIDDLENADATQTGA
ncbi:MAG: SMC-Scp complex subunit ScpB [Woeseiaceae bacterium]